MVVLESSILISRMPKQKQEDAATVTLAFLDLSGPREIKAVWKGSVTLPCAYAPVEDLVQQTLTWSVVHDQSSGTIFRRDGSEDHVLLSEYRARVSVPKDTPGNVSLVILNLEVTDRGTYTCQVTWRASNNSLIAKEITTKVEVVKVAATKPIIRAGELGLTVPAGASTSLTCEASGSPPISYRWFRSIPGGKVPLQSNGAELVWDNLRPSDSGMYFCEAANRAGAGVAQQSDAVELTVTDLPTTTATLRKDVGTPGRHHLITDLPTTVTAVTSESGVGHPEKNYTTQDFQRTGLPLHLVILIAVVCGAVVFLVIFLITCIRKPKDALLDLSGVHQVKGTWMGSTTLPCTYVPSEGFTEQALSWSVERDSSTSTIFRRDDSGDHIFLSNFRDRISIPKHSPGNVSLVIEKLEMPDSGHYTCKVIWRSTNNTLITREVTTTVKIVKVAATKPIIRAGELGLTVPAGASTSLTCEASGSPPISYRWFRSIPGGKVPLQSNGAELVWDNLRPSDSGMYFCEAANRAGAGVAQQSDAVELTVTDLLPTTLVSRMDTAPEGPVPDTGVTALEAEVEVPVKCLHKETCNAEASNDTFTVKDRKSPEYENLVTAMESEYETEGI
ncbi:hypothetical protein BTVI_48267 [Pitangus sulphuratus]|nr:hypothetical protein BTVI_48267 [Pitangus sulphuratus]